MPTNVKDIKLIIRHPYDVHLFTCVGRQVLTEMLLSNPTEVLGSIGGTVVVLDMLQQETSVWDFLLGLPDLFLKPSDEEILNAGAEELEDLKKSVFISQLLACTIQMFGIILFFFLLMLLFR